MADIGELKKIPILRHLSDSELEKLAAAAEKKEFGPGVTIFDEGIEQDSLFIILSGNVLITKATHSGEQKTIATLGPGAFFGEMALFDDFVRSATARAAEPVRALEISKKTFTEFLSNNAAGASKLLLEIMRTVAPRIRQTNRELVALYETGRIIGEQAEPGEILSTLLGILSDATSCSRGVAFLLNPAAGVMECRAAFGYEADPSSWAETPESGIAAEIIGTEGAVSIEDFPDAPRFASMEPVGYETASMLGVSLRAQGQPIGIIVLCDKIDRHGNAVSFTSGDANLLSGIAAQASGAIESARLHEEAREKEKLERVYFRH